MTSIRITSVSFLFALLILFGFVHITNASEISGTLSSDGSSPTQQESSATMNGTQNESATGQVLAQNQSNGQLQGSVVQGREDSKALALGANASLNAAWITLLAGGAVFATLAFLWYRRVL